MRPVATEAGRQRAPERGDDARRDRARRSRAGCRSRPRAGRRAAARRRRARRARVAPRPRAARRGPRAGPRRPARARRSRPSANEARTPPVARATTWAEVSRNPSGVITTPLPPPSTTRPPRTRRETRRFATEGASRSATPDDCARVRVERLGLVEVARAPARRRSPGRGRGSRRCTSARPWLEATNGGLVCVEQRAQWHTVRIFVRGEEREQLLDLSAFGRIDQLVVEHYSDRPGATGSDREPLARPLARTSRRGPAAPRGRRGRAEARSSRARERGSRGRAGSAPSSRYSGSTAA